MRFNPFDAVSRATSVAAFIAVASLFASVAQAELIDFEDAVAVNGYQIPSGYKGFVWSGQIEDENTESTASSWVLAQPSNDIFSAHSGDNYAWSNDGAYLTMSGAVFDFNSMWAYGQGGEFNDDPNLTARGYLNGIEIYTSTFALVADEYSLLVMNFAGIDSIRFEDGTGAGNFTLIIDDISVSEHVPPVTVPENSSSIALLGLAVAGLGLVRRKVARA